MGVTLWRLHSESKPCEDLRLWTSGIYPEITKRKQTSHSSKKTPDTPGSACDNMGALIDNDRSSKAYSEQSDEDHILRGEISDRTFFDPDWSASGEPPISAVLPLQHDMIISFRPPDPVYERETALLM